MTYFVEFLCLYVDLLLKGSEGALDLQGTLFLSLKLLTNLTLTTLRERTRERGGEREREREKDERGTTYRPHSS